VLRFRVVVKASLGALARSLATLAGNTPREKVADRPSVGERSSSLIPSLIAKSTTGYNDYRGVYALSLRQRALGYHLESEARALHVDKYLYPVT